MAKLKIRNKATGEIKEIEATEAQNFGLDPKVALERFKAQSELEKAAGGEDITLSAEDKKTGVFKQKVIGGAQKVLDVLDQAEQGKLTGKAYEDALNFASAEFTKTAFGEGGKQLTEIEQALIAGSIPKVEIKKQNIIQKLLGQQPPQTGKVLDDPATLRRKASLAISGLSGKAEDFKSQLSNIEQTAKTEPYKGFLSGDIETGRQFADLYKNREEIAKQGGLLKLLFQNPEQFAGTIGSDIEQAKEDPFGTLYRNPVGSLLNVLALRGGVSGLKNLSKVGVGTSQIIPQSSSLLEKVIPGISNLKGRAATNIVVANPESVTQSEELGRKILQATKSNSIRGMAKEADEIVPKAGQIIDSNIGQLNNSIGPMPRDEIIEQVMLKVANTSEARVNPKLLNEVRNILREELKSGQLEGGAQAGELFATDMIKINNTRKALNATLDSWHKSGRPVGTPTNDLNSMKWQASNALKGIIGEADEGGMIARSLDLQHTAFETIGPLSKKALQSTSEMGLWKSAFDKLYNAFVKPGEIAGARALQGQGTDIMQMIKAGITPTIPPIQSPILQQILKRPMQTESYLPSYPRSPLGNILKLKRDMRFKQGNPQFK